MAESDNERVRQSAKEVARIAAPALEAELKAAYGPNWLEEVNKRRAREGRPPGRGLHDHRFTLSLLAYEPRAAGLTSDASRRAARQLVGLSTEAAHDEHLDGDDAMRGERLAREVIRSLPVRERWQEQAPSPAEARVPAVDPRSDFRRRGTASAYPIRPALTARRHEFPLRDIEPHTVIWVVVVLAILAMAILGVIGCAKLIDLSGHGPARCCGVSDLDEQVSNQWMSDGGFTRRGQSLRLGHVHHVTRSAVSSPDGGLVRIATACAPVRLPRSRRPVSDYCVEVRRSDGAVLSRWMRDRPYPDKPMNRYLCGGLARDTGRCSGKRHLDLP
jgi:hypothetical protein